MEPSKKSPELETFLDEVTQGMFGRSRRETILAAKCVVCGKDAFPFRDVVSINEYSISGMCQACQDEAFQPGGE